MLRFCSTLFALVAAGLLVWAGYTAYRTPGEESRRVVHADDGAGSDGPKGTGLIVENAEQDLGPRPVGGELVTFRVSNHTREPAEVVGFTEGCQGGCCFFLKESARKPVSPGETVEVVGVLSVPGPGPFQFVGEIYLQERGALKTVPLKVVGVGLPAGSKNEDPH